MSFSNEHTIVNHFIDSISIDKDIYAFSFDEKIQLTQMYPRNNALLQKIMEFSRLPEKLCEFRNTTDAPIIINSLQTLNWIIIVTCEKDYRRFHVLGPFSSQSISKSAIEKNTRQLAERLSSAKLYRQLIDEFMSRPMVPFILLQEYALMLYYLLTGLHVKHSDIHTHESIITAVDLEEHLDIDMFSMEAMDRVEAYRTETDLMIAVSNGDLSFIEQANDVFLKTSLPAFLSAEPLRTNKNHTLMLLALITQAADTGRMRPELSRKLQAEYVKTIELCENGQQLALLFEEILETYIREVHRLQLEIFDLSPEVVYCREYIRLHICEELNIQKLASHFNYSAYYFSRKFKKECGITIQEYIKKEKIEKTKQLLLGTSASVNQISDAVGFCSSSYFVRIFKEIVGCTPIQYRRQAETHQPIYKKTSLS